MEIDIEQIKELILSRADYYRELCEFSEKITHIHSDRSCKVRLQLINNIYWVDLYRDLLPFDGFEIIFDRGTVTCVEHYLISDSISAPVTNYPRIILDEFSISEQEFLLYELRRDRKEKLKYIFEKKLLEG